MLLFCDVSRVEQNRMVWDCSVLKFICVSFINIIIFVNYMLIFCIPNFCVVLSFFFFFCFIFFFILLFLSLFFLLFFYLFFFFFFNIYIYILIFFIIWYLQLCLWTCSSFVNDCTAIIWYAGCKLVIGASLRTAIIPILKFKFALPLIQQNCNLSITDLLINDIILISFCKPFRSLLFPVKTNVGIHQMTSE